MMSFFAYIAIVFVSIAGILLELDWLTKPKSDTRSPVQVATRTDAPPAKADAKSKAAGPVPAYTVNPDTPQVVSPKKPDAPQPDQAVHDADGNPPAVTKDTPPPARQADGSTAGRALASTAETSLAPAPVTAAVVPAPAAPAAQHAPAVAAVSPAPPPNSCDVKACSSAYQSFRASDCTYQPFEGPRRACENPPAGGRAVASQPRAEPRHQATYRSRDDESDRDGVVRRLRPVDADDTDDADEADDRGTERSRVIVIERPMREPR
jgi:hypothetical protein